MYLLIPIVASILISLARGKDLNRFAFEERFRLPWLVLIALILRVLLYVPPVTRWALETGMTPYLNPVPYVVVIVFVLANLHQEQLRGAFVLIAFGSLLNLLTVLANGGFMPGSLKMMLYTDTVPAEAVAALQKGIPYCHTVLIGSSTRLSFLGDIIPLPLPHPFAAVFSAGDACIGLGAFWLFQALFPDKN